jgi:AcrR family transcriptional regulator
LARRKKSPIGPRKEPQQERSSRLVEAVLQAAVRVLKRDGAAGFNTIRIAEQAGVSVGSLYQYFPNKQSILVRLQEDEWERTGQMLHAIFTDTSRAADARLRAAMRAFFLSECDEAPLRRALGDAASVYRTSPQAREQRQRGMPVLLALLDEAAGGLPARRRSFAADLFIASMTSLGKHVSETDPTPAEVEAWATATADMFLAYLRQLAGR